MAGEQDRCIKCGSCMRACPVLAKVGEGVFPGPRTLAVDCVRERRASMVDMDEALKCSMCHACAAACPMRIELPHAILQLRERGHANASLRPGHARMVNNIDRYRVSVEPNGNSALPSETTSSTCFFPGCIGRYRLPDLAISALGLISKYDGPAACPPELGCCGSPLQKIGDKERSSMLKQENLAILERFERIVASCPGCTGQLVSEYHLEAMHMVEYIYEDIGLSRITRSAKGKDLKVALHHPCHLNRRVGASYQGISGPDRPGGAGCAPGGLRFGTGVLRGGRLPTIGLPRDRQRQWGSIRPRPRPRQGPTSWSPPVRSASSTSGVPGPSPSRMWANSFSLLFGAESSRQSQIPKGLVQERMNPQTLMFQLPPP